MAIAYKSQGAGAEQESSGVALTLVAPAVVAAGDILIAHVVHLNNTTAPTNPGGGWEQLFGPSALGTGTPTGRAWAFGKIADGTEDGASISFGTAGGTDGRMGRIYSYDGRVSGTILELVRGFAENSSETDPVIQAITTTVAGAKAVALVSQDDNNTHAGLGAVTGGTWVESVADFVSTTVGPQGGKLQIQTGTPTADPGTIAGGTVAGTDDEANTICFEIRPSVPVTAVARISLASGNTPTVDTDHSIEIRARVTSGTGTIFAALYEGASNRSGDLSQALTTSLADYSLPIAEASAANITSYSDLEIRLWGYAASGGLPVFEVAELSLETPEGVATFSLVWQPARSVIYSR